MDALGVLKGDVETVQAHEARVEELVHLKGEQGAKDHDRPGVTFVGLHELLIASIFTKDDQEENTEDKVAKYLYEEGESCAKEDQRQDIVCYLGHSLSYF